MEALDVGILVESPSGAILYANARAVELLGQASPVVGRSATETEWEVVRPDGSPLPVGERPDAVAVATRRPVRDVVLGVRDRRGDWRWLLVGATPQLVDGEVAQVVIALSDVSVEQRRLAASEQLYRSVVRAMSEGVAVHEPSGAIREANPAAERILGLTAAQLAGREAIDPRWRLERADGAALSPDEIPSEITARTGQHCERVQLAVHRPGGERAWLAVSTQPLGPAPAPGERVAVVATFADVSDEREVKVELERSRALFQRVTDAVPGVLYQLVRGADGRWRVRFVSARVTELLGLAPADVHRSLLEVMRRLHHDDRRRALASLAQAARDGAAWQCELRALDASNGWRWLRSHATCEREGSELVWSGVVLDVTEEHRLAEQVAVAQRREAIVSVTAGIAHNFNNSLAVLVPNLRDAIPRVGPDVRPLLEDALETARSSAELVKQLMHITRTQQAERGTVDLAALVRNVAGLSRRLFQGRVLLTEEIAAQPAVLHASAAQLQQVVLNLCINARDAVAQREDGRVELSLRVVRRGGAGEAEIVVRDNGAGMSPEVLRRLGEPFFTTKAPGKGTGLGLATAYATVRSLGGRITCASEVGVGTTFTIVLPLASSGQVAPVAEFEPAPVASAPRGRLLLVDDDPLVRRALSRMLSYNGWTVEEVAGGAAALARLSSEPDRYRAVVLDLSMAGMRGETVFAELRRVHPSLPVVVVSGFVEAPELLEGAAAVLTKPVAEAEIVAVLDRVAARPMF